MGSTSKKKTKKTSGLGLILLYVVWYLSKILRGHIVPHFLRFLFFPPSTPKKKSPEIPVFPTILVVLPPESFSRDPSFSHYLGGPSPKKFLKRSQLFPLSWGSFPLKKKSPEIPVFPTFLGFLLQKQKKFLKRSQFFPLSWGSFPPPTKKISRDPSFSHYLGVSSQKKKSPEIPVFPTIWGSFPPKKSPEIPVFPTILVVLPPPPKKKISRDPSFSHYLGGPSPRKFLQRSQFFPLSWRSFPKKISQEIPAFPTGGPSPPPQKKNLKRSQLFPLSWWSFPPPKKKTLQRSHFFPLSWGSFPRDPSFSHYLGGPSPLKKKISRNPTFSHYLGALLQKLSPEIPLFPTILGVHLQKKNQKDIRAGADSALRRLVPV